MQQGQKKRQGKTLKDTPAPITGQQGSGAFKNFLPEMAPWCGYARCIDGHNKDTDPAVMVHYGGNLPLIQHMPGHH